MKIITEVIKITLLRGMMLNMFGNFVKAVIDVEKEIMAIDGELHADEEALLLVNGSKQENLWGFYRGICMKRYRRIFGPFMTQCMT
mgnify:CR=1 FL=1